MKLKIQEALETSSVKSNNHLVVNGNDRDRQLTSFSDQVFSGLSIPRHVNILKGNSLRRKKLLRRLARHSRGCRIDDYPFH